MKEAREDYFFFVFLVFFFEVLALAALKGLGPSLERVLFILAALFAWMTFFLAALSVSEIAFLIAAGVFFFLASRIATPSRDLILSLTAFFLLEERSALFAVLVTGMKIAPFCCGSVVSIIERH